MPELPPWETLPEIPKPGLPGSDSEDDMHRAIGNALAGWAELEDTLARIFYEFTASLGAVRAFGVVESFFALRKMVQAAAIVYFGQPQSEEGLVASDGTKLSYAAVLEGYLQWCEKLASLRNNIVHGRVYREISGTEPRVILAPQMHDARYRLDRDKVDFKYTFADVDAFAKIFRQTPRGVEIMMANIHARRDALRGTSQRPAEPR